MAEKSEEEKRKWKSWSTHHDDRDAKKITIILNP